jgi:hypothetical protein
VETQRHADRQVNARNRFARENLRCKNHQIRRAPIEIVSIGHDIAFVFAGAERRRRKYGFARCAVLETVLLDRAAFKVVLEQDIARRVARPGGRGDDVILELLECGRISLAMRPADAMGHFFNEKISTDHFFNEKIKDNFDCRTHRVPAY